MKEELIAPAEGFDDVRRAQHYNSHPSGIEAKHLLRFMSFNYGTAMKYVLRAGLKPENDEVKDLCKAEFYLLDELENRTSPLVVGREALVGWVLVEKIYKHEENTAKKHAIMSIWWASVKADHELLVCAVESVRILIGSKNASLHI